MSFQSAADVEGKVEVVKQGVCIFDSDVQHESVETDVVWSLSNFRQSNTAAVGSDDQRRRPIRSPGFKIECCGCALTNWFMAVVEICPRILKRKEKGAGVGVFLLDKSDSNAVQHKPGVELLIGNGAFDSSRDLQWRTREGVWYGVAVTRDELQNICHKVPSDQLVIKATITIYHTHSEAVPRMYDTLLKLFRQQLGDLTVRCEDRDIKVSKQLLIDASPVFEAMMSSGLKEAQEGIVPIEDLDYETVYSLLEYLYTSKLTNKMNAAKLLIAADKYQMSELMEKTEQRLVAGLSLENACEMLHVADKCSAKRLKDDATKLICSQRNEVMTTEGWNAFLRGNANLLMHLFTSDVQPARKRKHEED